MKKFLFAGLLVSLSLFGFAQEAAAPSQFHLSCFAQNYTYVIDSHGQSTDQLLISPTLNYDKNGSGLTLSGSFYGDGSFPVLDSISEYTGTYAWASCMTLGTADLHLNLFDGKLYTAGGKLNIKGYVPTLTIDGAFPLVGEYVGGNPYSDTVPSSIEYANAGMNSSFGDFVAINVIPNLSVGVYVPLGTISDNTPFNSSFGSATDSMIDKCEFVARYTIPEIATIYAGDLEYSKQRYAAIDITAIKNADIKIGVNYNWDTDKLYDTADPEYTSIMLSGYYDFHVVKESIDAGVGIGTTNKDCAIVNRIEAPVSGPFIVRLDVSYLSSAERLSGGNPEINGTASYKSQWQYTDDYICPWVVIKADQWLPNEVDIGFQYNYRTQEWSIPVKFVYLAL